MAILSRRRWLWAACSVWWWGACTPLTIPYEPSMPSASATPSSSPTVLASASPTATPTLGASIVRGTVGTTVFDGNSYAAFYAECLDGANPNFAIRLASSASGCSWTPSQAPGDNFRLIDLTFHANPNAPGPIALSWVQIVSTDQQGAYVLAPATTTEMVGYVDLTNAFAPPATLTGSFAGSSQLGGALQGNFIAQPCDLLATQLFGCGATDANSASSPNSVSDANTPTDANSIFDPNH